MALTKRLRKTADVAQVVMAARAKAGLTQQEVADRANVSRQWLSLFESGKTRGAELSRVLGVLVALDVDLTATIEDE